MNFFRQTVALTGTGIAGIRQRLGSSLVTVVGVTTSVAVLVSLLAVGKGSEIFTGQTGAQDTAVVLNRGATNALQSVLTRETVAAIAAAPGVRRSPDGIPWVVATTVVSVDAIKKNGARANTYLVGFSPGVNVAQSNLKIIAGRNYRQGLRELTVPEPITKGYRNMTLGSHVMLRGSQWTIVGVFAGQDTIGDSALRSDADTVMSAFGINTYQIATVTLTSPAAYETFKNAVTNNPAISVDVKTGLQYNKDQFGALTSLVDFVAYFVGAVMGSGAVFGALNSLYASVDARRREIATLRAIGFGNGPIVISVILEGVVLALPGALLGAFIAWIAFNGNSVDVQGLVFKLTVTPHLVLNGIIWALTIGLIGASLPAMRAARTSVTTALRAT
jgi:putative ABC transport system permease protein